jgi:hypothetical protein
MPRKTLSLGWELMSLQAAIDGARILVDGIANHQLGSEHDERAAPHAASAMLSLVSLRLRDVWRSVQGATDPGDSVWAPHNATTSTSGQHGDVYLKEWSAERVLIAAENALARAHAAVERQDPKRKRKGKR